MKNVYLGLGLLSLIMVSGCRHVGFMLGHHSNTVVGSGEIADQKRSTDTFHAVVVGGALDVQFVPVKSAKEAGVSVRGDSNLVKLVETTVKDGTLRIKMADNTSVSSKSKLKATIRYQKIDSINISGACDVELGTIASKVSELQLSGASQVSGEIATDSLKLDMSGASEAKLKISGNANRIFMGLSGACNVEFTGGTAHDVEVEMSGACNVSGTLNITGKIEKEITGASTWSVGN